MRAQLLVAGICLAALVLSLDEATSAGKSGGKSKTKGKSVVPPSKTAPIIKGKDEIAKVKPVVKPVDPAVYNEKVEALKTSSANWKATPDQNAALGKLLGNQPLTDQDRQQLTDLLFNAQAAGLSKQDEVDLGYLLLDQAASTNVASADPVSDVKHGPLFLKVYNNTGEKLKVWVEVVPEMADAKPDKTAPMKKPLPLQYELIAGKAYDLQKDGKKLQATTVKVWAISPTRSWAQHRDEPLQLTMDMKMSDTYLLTFSDKE